MLSENIEVISHYLFCKKHVGGLIFPESFIRNLDTISISDTYEDEIYVKTASKNLPNIDYLYSEVFYLNVSDK